MTVKFIQDGNEMYRGSETLYWKILHRSLWKLGMGASNVTVTIHLINQPGPHTTQTLCSQAIDHTW